MLKLVSLNIEQRRHFERAIPFFKAEVPDVVCLQEVLESDIPYIERELRMQGAFMPMHLQEVPGSAAAGPQPSGIALLSPHPLAQVGQAYYYRAADTMLLADVANRRGTISQVVLWATVPTGGAEYTVATTHFTWSKAGEPDDHQRADASALLAELATLPPHILCGDMNAPRGKETFARFAERYADAIPPEYRTSLDLTYHRAARDPVEGPRIASFMVDCLFLSREYTARGVRLANGVSDHLAVVAHIGRSSGERPPAGEYTGTITT